MLPLAARRKEIFVVKFFYRKTRPIFLGALSIIIEKKKKNAVRLWPPKRKNKSFDTR